jgi:hypothetical protein
MTAALFVAGKSTSCIAVRATGQLRRAFVDVRKSLSGRRHLTLLALLNHEVFVAGQANRAGKRSEFDRNGGRVWDLEERAVGLGM